MYKEQSKLLASRVLRPQHASLADGYWLVCKGIAKIWGTLMGEVLPMDHPVAYDMVLEHVLHVRMGYMTHGAIPGPGMQEDRRHCYVIVNSSRSNEEGKQWGMAVWDGTTCPEAITFVDPYENPWRFEDVCRGARRMGLQAQALGARHRTCG